MSNFRFRSSFQRLVGLLCFGNVLALSSCSDSSSEKQPKVTLKGNAGIVAFVAYSLDGKRIATCHWERPGRTEREDPGVLPSGLPVRFDVLREVKIWDAHTWKEQLSINKGNGTGSIAFYPDSQRLAGVVADNVVKVWDTTTAKEVLVFKGHTGGVSDLDISRDGKRLVTASYDGTVKVWDALTGTCLHTLRGHPHQVYRVSFSPDSKRVASIGREDDSGEAIRIWDVIAEKQVLNLTRDTRIGRAVFSPDGERLASYSNERAKDTRPGLVEVWDATSGELLFVRKAHSAPVTCIAYSPDGKRLASGSEHGTVIVRDAVTGEEIFSLVAHRKEGYSIHPISSIAFSPDGNQLATASWDGTVKIWDVKEVKTNE